MTSALRISPQRLARALLLTDRTGTTDRAFEALDRWEHVTNEPRSSFVKVVAAMVVCQRQLNERIDGILKGIGE